MKKFLAMLLALVMVLGLVACGGNSGNGNQSSGNDAQNSGDPTSECLARWNLLASALVLIASAVRLWTLEQGQGRAVDTLVREENVDLPA